MNDTKESMESKKAKYTKGNERTQRRQSKEGYGEKKARVKNVCTRIWNIFLEEIKDFLVRNNFPLF